MTDRRTISQLEASGYPQGKDDQDRRQSRQPRPLYRFPDGGSLDPEKPLRRHPAVDRGVEAATRYFDGVMRSVVTRFIKNHGRGVSR